MYPQNWRSVESLRDSLPKNAKPVAHWQAEDAAFLAAQVPEKAVQMVVRLDSGRTELRFDGERVTGGGTRVESLDLEGARVGTTVVLFHTEARLAASALSFDTGDGKETLQFILAGFAPGMWEVWRNGWVVEIGVPVRGGEAVLAFKGRTGSYFVRRLQ